MPERKSAASIWKQAESANAGVPSLFQHVPPSKVSLGNSNNDNNQKHKVQQDKTNPRPHTEKVALHEAAENVKTVAADNKGKKSSSDDSASVSISSAGSIASHSSGEQDDEIVPRKDEIQTKVEAITPASFYRHKPSPIKEGPAQAEEKVSQPKRTRKKKKSPKLSLEEQRIILEARVAHQAEEARLQAEVEYEQSRKTKVAERAQAELDRQAEREQQAQALQAMKDQESENRNRLLREKQQAKREKQLAKQRLARETQSRKVAAAEEIRSLAERAADKAAQNQAQKERRIKEKEAKKKAIRAEYKDNDVLQQLMEARIDQEPIQSALSSDDDDEDFT